MPADEREGASNAHLARFTEGEGSKRLLFPGVSVQQAVGRRPELDNAKRQRHEREEHEGHQEAPKLTGLPERVGHQIQQRRVHEIGLEPEEPDREVGQQRVGQLKYRDDSEQHQRHRHRMPKSDWLVSQDAGQEEPGVSPQKQNVLRQIDQLAIVRKDPLAHGPFEDGEQQSRRDRLAPAAHAESEQCSA